MFGIKFVKFQPGIYVLKYKNGKIIKEGGGLSFFYHAPSVSLMAVPGGSIESPFIFEEATADYQTITVQGQVTFRISDPKKIAGLLNYTLDKRAQNYLSDDPDRLAQRIINVAKVLTRKQLATLKLRDAIAAGEKLTTYIASSIKEEPEIISLGVEVLGVSILAIKPNQETARALEAEAREQILKEADNAIYARRNASVEQERTIKENELNTEIAVENKKREIQETQMNAKKAVQEKEQELQQSALLFKIEQERKNKDLVALAMENNRSEADARAYEIGAILASFKDANPQLVQSLSQTGMDANALISLAFQNIAQQADKIGNLSITPDLLEKLLETKTPYEQKKRK